MAPTSDDTARKTPARKRSGKRTTKAVATRPRTRQSKYDWPRVRELYVSGIEEDGDITYPTLQQVAERFGIPPETVRKHSMSEHWPRSREQHQIQIETAKRHERAKKLTQQAVQLDESAVNAARVGLNLIQQRLVEIMKTFRERDERKQAAIQKIMEGGYPSLDLEVPVIDAREMESLARAAISYQQLGKTGLGEDIHKVTVSGPNGSPIQVQSEHTVTAVLMREDPNRLRQFAEAAQRSGVLEEWLGNVVEGEVVNEDDEAR